MRLTGNFAVRPWPLLLLACIATPSEAVVSPKRIRKPNRNFYTTSTVPPPQQKEEIILFESDVPNCRTPQGYPGECVPISQCPKLYDALLGLSDFDTEEFLLRSHCGKRYDGVCCGFASRLPSITDNVDKPIGFSTPRPRQISTPRQPANTHRVPPTDRVPPTTEKTTTTPASSDNVVKQIFSEVGKCGRRQRRVSDVRIVGGEPSRLGEWPWIVALGYHKRHSDQQEPMFNCGGTLISDRYVLTAGHCAFTEQPYLVRLGDLDLISTTDGASPIDVLVDSVIGYPGFDSSSLINDIAIVILQESVAFNEDIQPICLPTTPELRSNDFAESTQTVAGWGATYYEGPTSSAMQHVLLPVLTNQECGKSYSRVRRAEIGPWNICAGYTNNKRLSACQGDSGGPLMIRINGTFYLTGIVSYGIRCADSPFPVVFTRVTYFVDWIVGTVQ